MAEIIKLPWDVVEDSHNDAVQEQVNSQFNPLSSWNKPTKKVPKGKWRKQWEAGAGARAKKAAAKRRQIAANKKRIEAGKNPPGGGGAGAPADDGFSVTDALAATGSSPYGKAINTILKQIGSYPDKAYKSEKARETAAYRGDVKNQIAAYDNYDKQAAALGAETEGIQSRVMADAAKQTGAKDAQALRDKLFAAGVGTESAALSGQMGRTANQEALGAFASVAQGQSAFMNNARTAAKLGGLEYRQDRLNQFRSNLQDLASRRDAARLEANNARFNIYNTMERNDIARAGLGLQAQGQQFEQSAGAGEAAAANRDKYRERKAALSAEIEKWINGESAMVDAIDDKTGKKVKVPTVTGQVKDLNKLLRLARNAAAKYGLSAAVANNIARAMFRQSHPVNSLGDSAGAGLLG